PEYGSIVVQHRIVAILKQGILAQRPLLTDDGAAADRSAENPIDGAMSVIGAAVAVLAKGPAKFRKHHDHGVVPLGPQRLREHLQASSKAGQVGCERTRCCALAHMRVPPA